MPIQGYAQKLAAPYLPEGLIKWQGPTSYTVVTAGNPPTGGDSFPSVILGIDEILTVVFGGGYSGNFMVVPLRAGADAQGRNKWTLQWRALKTATIGGQAQTTGTEAASTTNLSAEYVMLLVKSRTA